MNLSRLMTALTVLAIAFLAFMYGAVAMQLRWWPSKLILDASNAALALWSVADEELRRNWPTSMEFFETEGYTGPTVMQHAQTDDDALIFVDGGSQQFRSQCPENGCIAWLMERDGTVRHVWEVGPELIWNNLKNVEGFSRAENVYSVGAHLFANGDLLVTYQGRNTYPYGVGMARFDKDSRLLWKKENLAHHWFSVAADGTIYVPAFQGLETPVAVGESNLRIECSGGVLQEDIILVLSPEGEELDRISILDAVSDSDYAGIVFQAIHSDQGLPLSYYECDPTHLNDVRLITAEQAATSPHLAEGDLLVSLRSNNALLAINTETRRVTWASVGRTVLQHSPRYMNDNTVLAFDNLGGDAANRGGTRLVRIEMDTDEATQVFPRPGTRRANMLSVNGGHIGLSEDFGRALVSLTRQGHTLEVDLATGEVLWEYFNTHDVSGLAEDPETGNTYARFAVQTVEYYTGPDFGFNR